MFSLLYILFSRGQTREIRENKTTTKITMYTVIEFDLMKDSLIKAKDSFGK